MSTCRRSTVAIAVLLLFAGCSGLLGGGSTNSPTEAVTPVPVPTETLGTEIPAVALPPGFEQLRLTDPAETIRAHRALLSARSYTFVERVRTFVEGERVDYLRVVRVENATEFVERARWSTVGTCTYSAPIGEYHRFDPAGPDESVLSYDPDSYGDEEGEDVRELFLDDHGATHDTVLRDESVTVRVVERTGTTLFRTSFTRAPNALRSRYENLTAYRAVAYVDPDGIVRRVRITFQITVEGRYRRVELVSAYTDVGSTNVETPAWVGHMRTNRTLDETTSWNISSDSPTAAGPCFGSNTTGSK